MGLSNLSLRTRMTLAVTGFVLMLMLVTATVTMLLFERLNEQRLKGQQTTIVELLADSIDTTIVVARNALLNNARAFPRSVVASPEAAQSWLDSRTGLKTQFFTSHLFLVRPDGTLLAMTPKVHKDAMSSPAITDVIKATFATGKPMVSNPVPCCMNPSALQIVFTAPVEVEGKVALVLGGSFNPAQPNIFTKQMSTKLSSSGFVRIISSDHKVVIHPDIKRINQKAAPDVVASIDKAFTQKEPLTVRHTGVNGKELLTCMKRLASADWVVATSCYTEELIAPERAARNWFIAVTILGTALAVLVVFYMMRLMTRPLQQLAEHLTNLSAKKGEDRFIHLSVNGEIGRLTGAFNSMVSEIDTNSAALLKSEERYRLVLENSADFIFWRRPDGSFEFVSPAVKDITGYSQEEFYADPLIMNNMVYPQDRGILEDGEGNRHVTDFCGVREVEYRIVTKDGETRWVRHSCTAIHNSDGVFLGRRGCISDISDKKFLADQVSHLVMHDILTGLPNRSLFADRLEVALAQAKKDQKYLVVMFFGIDRFKLINDTMGHEAGDALLIMTAERLRRQIHSEDTMCRFGGDVFSFILPSRDSKHEAVSMAYLILAALTEPFHLPGGKKITLTGSIGISVCPTDGKTVEALIKNAETAMYDSKKNGKNTFRFYTNTMNELAAEMLLLDSSMPASLAEGHFYIQYQPQLDFTCDSLCGVEALVRWRHPELGFIGPDRFIPLAEENGFIIRLGEWVLRTACKTNAEWIRQGLPPMRVAVNISARQFIEPDFIDLVSAALAESGLPADLLEIELTESMLVADEEQTLKRLNILKSMGVKLAIDDFGTGYSSLSYLKHFPLDRLKIDKSFVNDILSDPDDAAITDAIIAMSHALKLRVIAEGVETVSQLAFLKDRGCDEIQGYFISRPLSENDLVKFVKDKAGG